MKIMIAKFLINTAILIILFSGIVAGVILESEIILLAVIAAGVSLIATENRK